MKIASPTQKISSKTKGIIKKGTFPVKVILLFTLASSLFIGFLSYKLTKDFAPKGIRHSLREIAMDHGHLYYRTDVSLRDKLMQVPKRLTRNLDIPKIFIDIKFKELQTLYSKREQALKAGVLEQGSEDFVPAKIRMGNHTAKVKLRLKGDWTNHLEGEKWSFRVHTKGKDHLFGLRRFSIQHPIARGFQGEVIFHEALRQFGVLTPKYFFIDVVINGDSIGIMALEEHFTKELLERNGRKEGVIIRFDESLVWAARDGVDRGFKGAFDSYLNAPIDAFQSSKIKKSRRLNREYATAVGMLRGFINGHMSASQVFDVNKLGSYLGVAEFFDVWHEVRRHNQRFYLNPLTMKLEPIAFDASLQYRGKFGKSVQAEPIVHRMLEDPEINTVFKQTLNKLVEDVTNGDLIKHLKQVEKPHLEILQKEFVLLETFDYAELKRSAVEIQEGGRQKLDPKTKPGSFPVYIHAYLIQDGKRHYLELSNALPQKVEILSIDWVDEYGNTFPFEPATPLNYPLVLDKTDRESMPRTYLIDYQPLHSKIKNRLEIKANSQRHDQIRTTRAEQSFPSLHQNPMPSADVRELLDHHPFLSIAKEDSIITVQKGQWQVMGNIVIPLGYELAIPAGTTLQFQKEGSLIIYGATLFQGTVEEPIILEGMPEDGNSSGNWQGVAVYYALKRSSWSNVIIRKTSGINWPMWKLTGGVTFYQSDVDMNHCKLIGNVGEDALNIIHSDFKLSDVSIIEAASDGFDADFTTGTISGGLFQDIGKAGGGDGVDISGSQVTIDGTRFIQINDKAISVGEGSKLVANSIVANDCGVGAASKDNSMLEINNSTIIFARNAALMAYVKKPEFGSATLIANNISIQKSAKQAQVEQGSHLELNGEEIEPENLDVNDLYQTIMKPGLLR